MSDSILNPLNLEKLRAQFSSARPIPHIVMDNFLDPAFARSVAQAYPDFDTALQQGQTFKTVNEYRKVQICDSSKFAAPVARLNAALMSPQFLSDFSYITGIQNLLVDEQLVGGGIHITGPGGRLDVHVDFDYIESRQLHRRLNILIYLNEPWQSDWGGQLQLWDKDVKKCETVLEPIFNRCVIFQTTLVSFHGVVPVSPSAPMPRKSFAAYYYTKEAPEGWSGVGHDTIFKARPEEKVKGMVLMPAEALKRKLTTGVQETKHGIKKILGRE
jgi:Rps23 Pro-64 3,4-dihydroxylase Tpa1-like proline 4-hydroxylase